MQEMFTAGCCDDAETMATIKKVRLNMIMLLILIQPLQSLFTDKYVAQTGDTTKTIIASTASPFKFNPECSYCA